MTDADPQPHIDAEKPPAAPRWVKVFAIIAGLLLLLFVILHVSGIARTGHGP